MSAIEDFVTVVDQVHGAYLDATAGMLVLALQFAQFLRNRPDASEATPDSVETVALLGQVKGQTRTVHRTDADDYFERKTPDGRNAILLANLCLVAIYQYWEDRFRGLIATELDLSDKDSLRLDVMGELRHLRRSILHNSSRAVPEAANARLLPRFSEGEPVILSREQFTEIIDILKAQVTALSPARGSH